LKDKEACKVILWENEVSSNLRTVLRSQPKVKNFIGIVGPEGGFEPEEIESARNSGFQPVTLGHRILRSETASMALTAIVQYECGDLSLTLPDSTQSNSD
jgi:16S rRNA (uracil1498-N3)-methyltransferase